MKARWRGTRPSVGTRVDVEWKGGPLWASLVAIRPHRCIRDGILCGCSSALLLES